MADISLTIGSTTKQFKLAREQKRKLWRAYEQPMVPLKQAMGSPSYENLPSELVLPFRQNNWRGGMGAFRAMLPDMYADGLGIDTREPNKIILGPLITTVGAIAGTVVALEFYKDREYAATTTKVYRLATNSLSWGEVFDSSDFGSHAIETLGVYDDYIYVGTTTGKYCYSGTGDNGDWTQSTLDEAIAHHFVVAPPFSGTKPVFVKAERPNELRTNISPLNTGIEWSLVPYYIGDTTSDITSLMVLNGILLIGKEDGLYQFSTNGLPIPLLPEFQHKRSIVNLKYHTDWQSSLYFSLDGVIGELTSGYELDYMGPLERSPSLALNGSIRGMTSDDQHIYVCILVGSNYYIYVGRERYDELYGLRWEWVPYANLSTNACHVMKVMQRDGANPKLFFGYGTNMASIILPVGSGLPTSDSAYRYCAQGYLITSYFDAGYDTWIKIFYQLWTIARNLTTDINVKFYYQVDDDSSWTALATVITNDVQSADLAALSGKRVRLKVELNTNASATTPELEEFIYRGVLQPELTRLIDFTVLLEQSDTRKPSTDLAFLEGGRVTTAPITLKDLRMGTTRYVTFVPGSPPTEVEVLDEESNEVSYGAQMRVQELNWTSP